MQGSARLAYAFQGFFISTKFLLLALMDTRILITVDQPSALDRRLVICMYVCMYVYTSALGHVQLHCLQTYCD
jgi:hypothetical protein